MRLKGLLGLATFIVSLMSSGVSHADMLWLKGAEAPVPGIVVGQTDELIEYRYQVGGEEKTVQVDRDEIRQLVVTIDGERLENLSPDNLNAYLDQAEQLASFRRDQYAMALAKRLCLIVARWGAEDLRKSAFCLLVSICEGDELTGVLRLASIYEPTLNIDRLRGNLPQEVSRESREAALNVVRLIWRGQGEEAQQLLSRQEVLEQVRPAVIAYKDLCSLEELNAAAKVDAVTVSQLGRLLRLEFALSQGKLPPIESVDAGENWFSESGQVGKVGRLLPEFGSVLPFDPQLTIYRGGKWVAPKDE